MNTPRKHGYVYAPLQASTELSLLNLDDIVSDTKKGRTGLKSLLDTLECHDTLIVPSLAHLGDSLPRLLVIFKLLASKQVELVCIDDDLSVPHDEMTAHCGFLTSLVNFNRKQHGQARRQGIAKARKKGLYVGRKPLLVGEKAKQVDELIAKAKKSTQLADPHALSITDIAKQVGVSPSTLYRYLATLQKQAQKKAS